MTGRLLRATAPLWLTAISIADRLVGWALDNTWAGTEPNDCSEED